MRMHLAKLAAALALAGALPAAAAAQTPAQNWPQRAIKMIVPFPAGGGTDFIARIAARHLSDRLGQQVFVENRGGANGAIGLHALIGGEVQMGFNNVQLLLQPAQAGQLVGLAVAEPKRMPALPDLPAVAETVPGFEMAPWVGIVAPARTPKEIVERLAQETLAIMREPQVVKQLTEQQVTPFALGPDQLGDLIRKDLDKWAGVIKGAGIKGE